MWIFCFLFSLNCSIVLQFPILKAADVDETGYLITYSLEGHAEGVFQINEATAEISQTVVGNLDAETQGEYHLTVCIYFIIYSVYILFTCLFFVLSTNLFICISVYLLPIGLGFFKQKIDSKLKLLYFTHL